MYGQFSRKSKLSEKGWEKKNIQVHMLSTIFSKKPSESIFTLFIEEIFSVYFELPKVNIVLDNAVPKTFQPFQSGKNKLFSPNHSNRQRMKRSLTP